MESCDVLIVGGGPAGSSCARQLRKYGYDAVVMDKSNFPRDKICAGWIIPQVVESLELDTADYARSCTLQPLTGFQVGVLGGASATVRFDKVVSYGIRRCEFDNYLLRRCGARLMLGTPVEKIEQNGQGWIVNGSLHARMLIGAGGHFCPVARHLRGVGRRPLVTAVEVEFPFDGTEPETEPEVPRLYFCDDLGGYGWCVRKKNFLNIGLGRVDAKNVSSEMPRFLDVLKHDGAFTGDLPRAVHGHAYSLYDGNLTSIVGDRVMLIGDAAGLADLKSGEGIRPAVESGLLAAQAIHAAQGNFSQDRLAGYHRKILSRYGGGPTKIPSIPGLGFLRRWQGTLVNGLLSNRWFSRNVILKSWFLHSTQPALKLD